MQNEFDTKKSTVGSCVVCGKPVPRRDKRDTGPLYCGRVHAGLARYSTRYQGTNSGPLDRPTPSQLLGKTKFNQ